MHKIKKWLDAGMIILSVFLLSGCATMMPQTETVMLRCKVPNLEPLKETTINQKKGGVLISLAPQHYAPLKKVRIDDVDSPGPLIALLVKTSAKYVERRETPYIEADPDTLCFTVTVHNGLDRVFRGAGSVVSLNIDGKTIALDQIGYRDFLNIIVPPQGETQVKIIGPLISSLPEKCVIGIFIYDVTTEVDAAGNPRKKSNYEWYFNLSNHLIEEPGVVKVQQVQEPAY